MNPTILLGLELVIGAIVFGLALPRLLRPFTTPHPPGSLPDSDDVPAISEFSGYVLGAVLGAPLVVIMLQTHNPTVTGTLIVGMIATSRLSVYLSQRLTGRAVTAADPWFEPIQRLQKRAGIARLPIRIIQSAETQPTINLLGELLLPSRLLRTTSPREVAIAAAPAIVARRRLYRRWVPLLYVALFCGLFTLCIAAPRLILFLLYPMIQALIMAHAERASLKDLDLANQEEGQRLADEIFASPPLHPTNAKSSVALATPQTIPAGRSQP